MAPKALFAFQMGEKVGNDITAAADENEIVRVGIGEGCLIGLCDSGISVAVELMLARQFSNLFCRYGPVVVGLGEVVAGVLGEHGEDCRDVLVVDHSEDDA